VNIGVLIVDGIVFLLLLSAVMIRKKLRKCTYPVSARVVGHSDFGDTEGHSYRPIVEYTYQGKTQRSAIDEGNFSTMEKARQEYPVGKNVTVYIDPENPKICSSDPARDRDAQIIVIAAFVLLLVLSLSKLK